MPMHGFRSTMFDQIYNDLLVIMHAMFDQIYYDLIVIMHVSVYNYICTEYI
jgi:hypothetical protein